MPDLMQLQELGQSVWLDYILRSYLQNGGFSRDVAQGVRGVTSNPAIFEQAIGRSQDYDRQIGALAALGAGTAEIYEELALRDIALAAGILRGVHDASRGQDGFVSLEVSPGLARDAEGTIAEALHLFARLGLPNVMIKVPGTPEGAQAIEELTYRGLNINVTLLFSLSQYRRIAEAYVRGLERRLGEGKDVSRIHSVASFFVSRVDSLLDPRLGEMGEEGQALQGKAAVANARLAYAAFHEIFHGAAFARLKAAGANVQRPLWASTSTKNPAYRDTLYVEELIGTETVNTMPPATVAAFRDHGAARETLRAGLDEARQVAQALLKLGLDLDAAGEDLQRQGVASFEDAFARLFREIELKARELRPMDAAAFALGPLVSDAAGRIESLAAESAAERLRRGDKDLFAHPEVADRRLGWLRLPEAMQERLPELEAFVQELEGRGVRRVVLCGMGGSSLFPDVLRRLTPSPRIAVDVVDTTQPDAAASLLAGVHWQETAVLLASKSGTTREVDVLYRVLRAAADQTLGDGASRHFYAITDPGTPLATLAESERFGGCFLNPPDIGGRYSALSLFGLVPGALLGHDLEALLAGGRQALSDLLGPAEHCTAARLAATLAAAHAAGRQKLALPAPDNLPFVDWLEQLLAESTGKSGVGILPAPASPPGEDRLPVSFDGADAPAPHVALDPVAGAEALGRAVVTWECATALLGRLLEIDPFDEPNVAESKRNTEQVLKDGRHDGRLEAIGDPDEVALVTPPHYLAVQVYLQPLPEVLAAARRLGAEIARQTGAVVTVGFGPRYLHSTGQYHKGGPRIGSYLQLYKPPAADIDVPGLPFGMAALFAAQAEGDAQAVIDRGRPFARVVLEGDAAAAIGRLMQAVAERSPREGS